MLEPVIHIAYCEDQHLVRNGVVSLLHEMNDRFQVMIVAADGAELLAKIKASSYQPDVCIIDVSMPELDGYKTMKQIKTEYPFIKGLALSMYKSKYAILKMMRHGAHSFLNKDTHPRELEKAIIEIYTNGYYHSDIINEHFPNGINTASSIKEEFSEHQIAILEHCALGLTSDEIGKAIHLSKRTVDNNIAVLLVKLNARTRTSLVYRAFEEGIILDIPDHLVAH